MDNREEVGRRGVLRLGAIITFPYPVYCTTLHHRGVGYNWLFS